jgi:hypothetical protein
MRRPRVPAENVWHSSTTVSMTGMAGVGPPWDLEGADQRQRVLRRGVYSGAIQMLAEPTGRRLAGKWVGFGRDLEINVGPWRLQLVSSDASPAAVARYNRTPDPASV